MGVNDGPSPVWSLETNTAIVESTSNDTSGCINGNYPITLLASGGTFNEYFWYEDPLGGQALAQGSYFSPTITDQETFYVENALVGAETNLQIESTSTANCGAGGGAGQMFDITAKSSNIVITKVSARFRNIGTGGNANRSVKVYYREDSYQNMLILLLVGYCTKSLLFWFQILLLTHLLP
jgi:hypothetical protein